MEQVKTPMRISSGVMPVNSHCIPAWVTYRDSVSRKIKRERGNIKSIKEKWLFTYKRNPIILSADFSAVY